MGLGRTLCAALVGLDGHVVEVEAHVSPGLVQWVVVGLPDTGVLEARDRVRSALVASRQAPPQARVTVNLSPAGLPKTGTAFDLGVAVSVLAAVGQVPASVASVGHVGELGLDGAVRSVPGVLPAVLGLVRAGVRRVVVPHDDAAEARLVPGVEVHGVRCLAEAVALHRGEPWEPAPDDGPEASDRARAGSRPGRQHEDAAAPHADLSDVVGQQMGRRALEVVAAGGHHLLMLGPPGAGKTMLAARLPGVLPDLDDADALTATAVHSLAGTLVAKRLLRRPPFEAPHHTSSVSAVVGGGTGLPRPGAASRAHAGVLFLDECPEFRRGVLDALRQPLEQGVVEVQRAKGVARLPARFQLVMAANPCPCGNASAGERGDRCRCAPRTRQAYLGRLSGPLLDRVDVQVEVPGVERCPVGRGRAGGETAVVAARVREARSAALARWGAAWPTNAQVPGTVLRSRRHRPPAGVLAPLVRGVDRGTLTARGYDRALRVAWSLADLARARAPRPGRGVRGRLVPHPGVAVVSGTVATTPAGDPAAGCEDDRTARAHLSRVVEPGDRRLRLLLRERSALDLVEGLRQGRGGEVWQARHRRLAVPTATLVATAARTGIRLVVPADPTWPEGLQDLDDLGPRDGPDGGAPVCLWVRGELPPSVQAPPAASVVGARAATAYGQHVAEDLAAGLVARGWTVVSGAAYGIDAAAHRGALAAGEEADLPTVAVLAGGVDRASPAGHDELLRRVVERGGAVVSELPPGTRPAAYRFLLRNRLIAAWSAGTVVVEASVRSGALSTARTAAGLSRQVAVVPGPVTSATSGGSNRLLRDGASCVTCADDVVELLGRMGTGPLWDDAPPSGAGPRTTGRSGGSAAPAVRAVEHLGEDAVRVWHALERGRPREADDLVVAVGVDHRRVRTALGLLELEGVVEREGSRWRRGDAAAARRPVVP